MHKYHFVYKTTSESGKFYIGRHSANRLTDGYKGSGKFIRDCKKGKVKLTREILLFCDNIEELIAAEERLIKEHFNDPLCENYDTASLGREPGTSWGNHTEDAKRRIREKQLGVPRPYARGKEPHNKGKRLRPETIAKRTQSVLGSTRNETTRAKMRAAQGGENNPMYGKHDLKWWNNGVKSVRNVVCPGPEWLPGRVKLGKYKRNGSSTVKRRFVK